MGKEKSTLCKRLGRTIQNGAVHCIPKAVEHGSGQFKEIHIFQNLKSRDGQQHWNKCVWIANTVTERPSLISPLWLSLRWQSMGLVGGVVSRRIFRRVNLRGWSGFSRRVGSWSLGNPRSLNFPFRGMDDFITHPFPKPKSTFLFFQVYFNFFRSISTTSSFNTIYHRPCPPPAIIFSRSCPCSPSNLLGPLFSLRLPLLSGVVVVVLLLGTEVSEELEFFMAAIGFGSGVDVDALLSGKTVRMVNFKEKNY